MLRMSEPGVDELRTHEGLRLTAYRDTGGIWTIGYGHTGPEVREGLTITEPEARALLRKDLQIAEASVDKHVTIALDQHEVDALVSLVYNIGGPAFGKSTLLRMLNGRDRVGAAAEFARWHLASGKRVKGLLLRRLREAALFLGAAR